MLKAKMWFRWFCKLKILILVSVFTDITVCQTTNLITVNGVVTDQNEKPVEKVLVKVEHTNSALIHLTKQALTKKDGSFNISLDHSTGQYLLSVKAAGFQAIHKEQIYLETGLNNISIKLIPIETFSIDVSPSNNSEITIEHVELSQTLTKENINNVPVSRSHDLRSFIGTMSGVLYRPDGKLFFDGSPADQNNYLLDGFDVNDPITYQLRANIGVDAVDSFDRFSGRYSPEFGRGSGGTLLISPKTGDNKLRYNATNFFPGIDLDKGIAITNWRPRFSISGPLIKNRFFVYNQLDLLHDKNIITELPKGQDRTTSRKANDLLHLHVNLTPYNILTSNIMVNYGNAPMSGLSPLNPPETTRDQRDRIYFFNVKNQIFKWGGVSEIGYGLFDSFIRVVPQGHELLRISPAGNSGNSPSDITQTGRRHHFLANILLPKFDFSGNHRIKAGFDLKHSNYFQDIRRSGFEHFRLNGTRTSQTVFGGNGKFAVSMLESATYLQDEWSITPWLFLKGGIRLDRDSIVPQNAVTPRIGVALMPPQLKKTRFAASIGWIPSISYLKLFTRNIDQYAISTNFSANGTDIIAGPTAMIFTADYRSLNVPTTRNFSFGIDKDLTGNISISANYLSKSMGNGYIYAPDTGLMPEEILRQFSQYKILIPFKLRNYQTLEYNSLAITFNKRFKNGGYINGHYTMARGMTNAATDINIDDPITYYESAGPFSWDMPHRFASFGYFALTKNNALAYEMETHSGLPFTANDDNGNQMGKFNSHRFPIHANINLHTERKIKLFNNNWALRIGIDNIFNRANPTLVNSNTAALGFPIFYGIQPRKVVIRIRWLGKKI